MTRSEVLAAEYNSYYKNYIGLVENTSLTNALIVGLETTQTFFETLPKEKWKYQYAPDKWTPKDILQHVSDTERVFAYRALYFARFKNADLKGFDENVFAMNAHANKKSITDLINEYKTIRAASLSLFKYLNESELKQTGTANGSLMSVRAAGFIICGHEIHHCNIIKERYL